MDFQETPRPAIIGATGQNDLFRFRETGTHLSSPSWKIL
jgi:hypothetical protein